MSQKQRLLKIMIAGDGGIGKTTLLNMLCSNKYVEDQSLTVGAEFFVKCMEIHQSKYQILQLWDLGGQERFRFLMNSFLKGASGAVLGFDVRQRQSFIDLESWLQLLREKDPDLPVVLVAMKTDIDYHPMLSPDMAQEFVDKFGLIGFFEVSSKIGLNVESPFEILVDHIRNSH